MGYDPEKHHRRSMRLKGYDYRQPGMYFVTCCAWERQPLFEMPELCEMLTETWLDLPNRFSTASSDMFIIMPNHIHGVLSLHSPVKGVSNSSLSAIIGAYKSITTVNWIHKNKGSGLHYSGRLWQERFYDRIIRNDLDLQRIREYILNNPLNFLLRQGKKVDDKTWEETLHRLTGEFPSHLSG